MNKFDRITAILIHLQSKKLVTAQELADRFEVSLRTIYRDVDSLGNAGIPIIGEPGVGYSMMEGYRLPPVMFTQEEALSFMIAEKFLDKYGDTKNKKNFESALFKIKSVLKSAEKRVTAEMEARISVQKNYEQNLLLDKNLPLIMKSLLEKEVVEMVYLNLLPEGHQKVEIEPIGVLNEGGIWIVVAYGPEFGGYKRFRIDRISQIKLTGRQFSKSHVSLSQYISEQKAGETVYKPVISVRKNVAHYIAEQKYLYGLVDEQEDQDQVVMTFKTTCLQTFSRWFLTIADNAKVLEPHALQLMIRDIVKSIEKNL